MTNVAMVMEAAEITATRRWFSSGVREACIRNNLYTRGDCEAYNEMLSYVDDHTNPTYLDLYYVACDIYLHTKEQTITNIMFILEREAVITSFMINGSDEI